MTNGLRQWVIIYKSFVDLGKSQPTSGEISVWDGRPFWLMVAAKNI